MKKVICLGLSILLCWTLTSCGDSDNHIGEAKTPSGSSVMQGRNYEDVVQNFEKQGFTNIKLEVIQDLVTGWLTKSGEVEKVSVGGDENYASDQWVPADTEVIIYYHDFSEENSDSSTAKIVMPQSANDYIGSEWTIDALIDHFRDLGFTNIKTVPCNPDDSKYKMNIFELSIETGLFSTGTWDVGEEFDSGAEISIYYNEFPLLTIDNCSDLEAVLTGNDNMGYLSFCEKYDGRYVEFDAYVTSHLTYNSGIDHVIDVAGRYSEIGPSGMAIRIGDVLSDSMINYAVQEGDQVKVSGRIDLRQAKYFKEIYVETIYLDKCQ